MPILLSSPLSARARSFTGAAIWGLSLSFVTLTKPSAANDAAQEASTPAADRIPFEFSYEAPADCPTGEDAFALVHGRTPRVLRVRGADLRLAMRVVSERSGYKGVLTVQRAGQAPERRAMTGERCGEVVEALALTAALSIDPEATLTLGSPRDTPEWPDSAPVQPPADPSDEQDVPDVEERGAEAANVDFTWGFALAMERVMDHALHGGGRMVLVASARSPRVVLPLEARLSVDVLTELTRAREPTVLTRLLAVRPAYCPLRSTAASGVSLCGFSQLGALTAEAKGWEDAGRTTRFFASVGVEAWFRARLAPGVELWFSPAAGLPLTERRFAVSPGPEVVAATSPVSWALSAGVGWVL